MLSQVGIKLAPEHDRKASGDNIHTTRTFIGGEITYMDSPTNEKRDKKCNKRDENNNIERDEFINKKSVRDFFIRRKSGLFIKTQDSISEATTWAIFYSPTANLSSQFCSSSGSVQPPSSTQRLLWRIPNNVNDRIVKTTKQTP